MLHPCLHNKEDQSGISVCATSEPTALLIVLHGSGGSGDSMRFLAEALVDRLPYVKCLLPDAPLLPWRSDTHDKIVPLWYIPNTGCPPRGIEDPWNSILSIVYTNMEAHKIPLHRVGFIGFSMGAQMAAWIALRLPKPCAALVMLSGCPPSDFMRVKREGRLGGTAQGIPILFCHGGKDGFYSLGRARKCRDTLKKCGNSVAYKECPFMRHEITDEEVCCMGDFLESCLLDSKVKTKIEKTNSNQSRESFHDFPCHFVEGRLNSRP